MNIERIRKMLTNGFKPFTLYLSDGRKFSVPHPEFVAVGKRVVVVIGKNDEVNTVDPLHIVSLEEKLGHKAAWDAEIKRRVKEIESGAEEGIPAAQVMKEARRALNETRRLSSARRK